jgi:ATP-binding cassette subfamily F protein 3
VYEFKDHSIREHLGDISEYLRQRKLETLQELERKEAAVKKQETAVSDNKLKYERRKQLEREIRKLNNKIVAVEKEIEALELTLSDINKKLADPDSYKQEIQSGALYRQHNDVEEKIAALMQQWELLSDELENMKTAG